MDTPTMTKLQHVQRQITLHDAAVTLAGKMVTDGEICGYLTSTDGDTWSVTHRNGTTLAHHHDPDAHLSHLTRSPECVIKTPYAEHVRPLATLRPGVTLAKTLY